MRRSFTLSMLLPVAIAAFALLWLLWNFLPLSLPLKWLITLMGLAVAAGVLRSVWGRFATSASASETLLTDLPDGPVVLVMGKGLDALFGDKPVRKSATGSLHRIDSLASLRESVEQIWQHAPGQAGRLSVLFTCLPDQINDEGEFRAGIRSMRQLLGSLAEISGAALPLTVQCQLSGPTTPWFLNCGDITTLTDDEGNQQSIDDWQRQAGNIGHIPAIRQAAAFARHVILDELQKPDRLSPGIHPVALSLRLGAAALSQDSLWSEWLTRYAVMRYRTSIPDTMPARSFTEPLFAALAPLTFAVQGGRTARRVTGILLFCMLVAIACSVLNNRALIERTGMALQRWYAIPAESLAVRAAALSDLQQDALLLERWHRQGEPLRYGLGFYSGPRLWLTLQQAIDSYVPPSKQTPVAAPKIVRLDSMSLFDTGKSDLKASSTRMLVNSLVGIKARPGWLIVVSGHTDSTGSAQLNQTLSLQRAQAVRDWMRDTGDVPESCFAVQGYGADRPLESNDTPAGRAANRRVEISLVPQADACRMPDTTLSASQDDADEHLETE
ncbi:OmpA family protein [Type-D symbiont of Plautia stali]|uniref:OmpA family protein n=1 Tax=Type-D symbiont of Plautia stali TaxID=1560356 RepID=UPI0007DC46AA|nr:OmpA family protein [Type-D symbiont of Plautia stali]